MADHEPGRRLMDTAFGNFIVGCCALVTTVVGGIIGIVVYVSRKISTVGLMAAKDNEKLQVEESRARHDLRNDFTVALGSARSDASRAIQKLETELEATREKSASKAEVLALEGRTLAMIAELKTSLTALAEKVAAIPAIEAQSKMNGQMLMKLLRISEGKDG